VESAEEIAAIIKARRDIKTDSTALVIANPVKDEMDRTRHDAILASGLAGAQAQGVTGKAVTPFLLEHFHTASHGESLKVNIEIIKSNSALAADIAVALHR
jgi:pseudouridine-5'-phosphate glycosidase